MMLLFVICNDLSRGISGDIVVMRRWWKHVRVDMFWYFPECTRPWSLRRYFIVIGITGWEMCTLVQWRDAGEAARTWCISSSVCCDRIRLTVIRVGGWVKSIFIARSETRGVPCRGIASSMGLGLLSEVCIYTDVVGVTATEYHATAEHIYSSEWGRRSRIQSRWKGFRHRQLGWNIQDSHLRVLFLGHAGAGRSIHTCEGYLVCRLWWQGMYRVLQLERIVHAAMFSWAADWRWSAG